MDPFKITCFFGVVGAITFRSLLLRRLAGTLTPPDTATLAGLVSLLAGLTMLPFQPYLRIELNPQEWLAPVTWVLGLTKGVVMWLGLFIHQRLVHRSMASATYSAPVAVGFVGLVNYFAWGEAVSSSQWVGILGMGLLGGAFLVIGHIKELGGNARGYFAAMVAISVACSTLDLLTLRNANWFTYFMITALGMMITGVLAGRVHVRKLLRPGNLARMFVGWALTEAFIVAVLVTILPVSIVSMAVAMRLPILMVLSALLWHEGTVREQVAFSLGAVACCALMFF